MTIQKCLPKENLKTGKSDICVSWKYFQNMNDPV